MQSKIDRRFRPYVNRQPAAVKYRVKCRQYTSVIEKLDHDRLKFSMNQRASPGIDTKISMYMQRLSKLATGLYPKKLVAVKNHRNTPQ